MEKILSRKLEAGMVVAKEIVTKHGQTILDKGTVLSDTMIARLSFYRIDSVYVEDFPKPAEEEIPPLTEEPVVEVQPDELSVPEPVVPSAKATMSYTQRLKNTPEFQSFQVSYSKAIAALSTTLKKVQDGDPTVSLMDLLEDIHPLYHGKTTLDILDLLHAIRAVDDSMYAHSLNVALVARGIGRWLKLDKDDLNILTIAGLVHDIGKLSIPEEVLNKQGKLTDEEFQLIRQHPLTGNRTLKNLHHIDRRILSATLQHHERGDGSGYPRQLQQDEIDDFASIIAIADVYDAMTAARSYRAPLCAFQVIQSFEKDGLQKYDPKYILLFLDHIASSYQNSRVVLSDGRSCRIIYINHRA
ncbi:MAG: HD-GYP domain-containing protein, partial [Lachnospiraceae bacterium]|nr:HD-GYP domain-containing protein [Lachnospiraceae bacterium]